LIKKTVLKIISRYWFIFKEKTTKCEGSQMRKPMMAPPKISTG